MSDAADISLIESRRRAMKIPVTSLCAQAGVGRQTYCDALAGTKKPYPATLARLNSALNRFRLSFGGEAGALAPHAAYKACVVLAALWMKADARAALAADPARRATSDPDWMKAADVRRIGFWIATQQLGFRGSDVGRAAGVTKAAVSAAVKEIEDRRDHDGALDRMLNAIEEIFS